MRNWGMCWIMFNSNQAFKRLSFIYGSAFYWCSSLLFIKRLGAFS